MDTQMRDIRPDLEQRLEAVRAQRQSLLTRVKECEAEEVILKGLIDRENRRFHQHQPSLFVRATSSDDDVDQAPIGSPVRAFLEDVLADGGQFTLKELVALARERGVEIEPGKSMARKINATLLGLLQGDRVDLPLPGVWRLKNPDAPPAAAGEASGLKLRRG